MDKTGVMTSDSWLITDILENIFPRVSRHSQKSIEIQKLRL